MLCNIQEVWRSQNGLRWKWMKMCDWGKTNFWHANQLQSGLHTALISYQGNQAVYISLRNSLKWYQVHSQGFPKVAVVGEADPEAIYLCLILKMMLHKSCYMNNCNITWTATAFIHIQLDVPWLTHLIEITRSNLFGCFEFYLRHAKNFYVIFQTSNVLVIGRFQWFISTER